MSRLTLNRLPLRWRLALGFVLVMAAVFAITGWVIYARFATGLDREIDVGMQARVQVVSALLQQSDTGLREGDVTSRSGTGFVQVLSSIGHIVDLTAGAPRTVLLSPADIRHALASDLMIDSRPGKGGPVRLLAHAVLAQDRRLVIVVGTPLADRARSLRDLQDQLWLGGLVALLLASLTGFGLATAALRPIEHMRARAAQITIGGLDQRLPVPPANDEVGRLGATLNDMLSRLEVAVDRERTFIADASHELRTPLALLRTEIEVSLEGRHAANDLEQALRAAGNEVERLSRLAEALLLFARLDRGALQLIVEPLNLAGVVGMARVRSAARAERLGRTVDVDIPPGMVLVADRLRLEQALDNLIDNALRYGSGDVRVAAAEDGAWVNVHVRDQGPGFPVEFIDRAFDRFTRGHAGGGQSGSGIGLAIVAAVASAHGGSATASNAASGGADVCLRLPRGHEAAPHITGSRSSCRTERSDPGLRAK
ncbi:MAG: ATP-binding protein [Thermoleophilia bacterium]